MRAGFRLASVEQAFLSAVFEPSLWNAAMDCAARESGSQGAILLPVEGPLSTVPSSPSLSEASEYYFKQKWCLRDERYRGTQILKSGGVVVDLDLFSQEQIARHPYYQELLGRFGLCWFAGVPIKIPHGLACLSLQRTVVQGPFSKTQQRRLMQWGRHLSVCATLACDIGGARANGAMDVLEGLGAGALLMDASGKVIRINAAAERLLCRELHIRRNKLSVADRTASDQIGRVLMNVFDNCERRMLGPLSVPRHGRRPIILRFVRIDRIDANPFSHCTVVVLLTDAEQDGLCFSNEIFSVFGLTGAEIHLARILSSCEDLARAAARLHITNETARTRLKSIFAKTGTHKQGALVALFSRIGRAI